MVCLTQWKSKQLKSGKIEFTTAANLGNMVIDPLRTIEYVRSRVRKQVSIKSPLNKSRISIPIPSQIITYAEVQRSLSIRRIRPLPKIALCGWTHHQMLGEAICDSEGCNIEINKGEVNWLITMDKRVQKEGEEYIIEIVSTKWSEGNSVTIIQLDPNLEPLTRQTAVTAIVKTTQLPPTAIRDRSETSVPVGYLQNIWNLQINPSSLRQEMVSVIPIGDSTPEQYKDTFLKKVMNGMGSIYSV